MTPRPSWLVPAVLLLSSLGGCRPAGGGLSLYTDAKRRLFCEAPARWKALESQGGAHIVSFHGPPDGRRPFSAMIAVFGYNAKADSQTIGSFALSQRAAGGPGRLEPFALPDVQGYRLTQDPADAVARPDESREEAILIPSAEGFYAVLYSAPPAAFEVNRPLWLAVARSLRPRG